MNTRLIAAAILSLGFLSAGAFASESNNQNLDYGTFENAVPVKTSTHALQAVVVKKHGAIRVGDFIDETPEESHQRSSQRSN